MPGGWGGDGRVGEGGGGEVGFGAKMANPALKVAQGLRAVKVSGII